MIRVYIIVADTIHPLKFAQAYVSGQRQRDSVEALQEVLDIPNLADPQLMLDLAKQFHRHFYPEKRNG